jgi:hypothetical protein
VPFGKEAGWAPEPFWKYNTVNVFFYIMWLKFCFTCKFQPDIVLQLACCEQKCFQNCLFVMCEVVSFLTVPCLVRSGQDTQLQLIKMASSGRKCDGGRSETQREYIIRPVRKPIPNDESDCFQCLKVLPKKNYA